MFKKLLTVGALAAALIGGIGTASAFGGFYGCYNSQGYDNGVEVRSVVNSGNYFANVFDGNGFRWYFKYSRDCGNGQYVALYEGRRN
ncbi:hypothetical protein ID850_06485 [Xenorhabdus sp. Flor]|uniref:LCI fold-containing protein n=1 Tax=Xenorhabdus cabanillasii TaxID=351673 RepID=UPI0019C3D42D|nr:LCI fold-containing protein [Xenorhabdus sp. Flor]MBD2814415.1 hypothetical protein [Xenorhabdus sp. Flor]